MPKSYSDRNMAADDSRNEPKRSWFFPKHNPPVTIEAETREEAEEKLKELDNKK